MQPRPSAATSRPCVPNFLVCICEERNSECDRLAAKTWPTSSGGPELLTASKGPTRRHQGTTDFNPKCMKSNPAHPHGRGPSQRVVQFEHVGHQLAHGVGRRRGGGAGATVPAQVGGDAAPAGGGKMRELRATLSLVPASRAERGARGHRGAGCQPAGAVAGHFVLVLRENRVVQSVLFLRGSRPLTSGFRGIGFRLSPANSF